MKDYQEKIEKELKQQQQQIDALKRDIDVLQAKLSIQRTSPAHFSGSASASTFMGSQPSKKQTMQKAKELEKGVDYCRQLEAQIRDEQDKLAEAEEKSRDLVDKIKQTRLHLGGVNITKESNLMIERQIKVLENRLEKSLIRFNRALDDNKVLRKEIDDLSRERLAFDAIYKDLEKELQVKKKRMACIIELSNIAYEERDNAAHELSQLKIYAAREMQSFEETFKELDEILEEDRKTKEAIKARMAEASTRTKDQSKADQTKSLSATESDESKLQRTKGALGKTATTRTQAEGSSHPTTVQQYEEAFQKVRLHTGVADVNQLLQKFAHAEDENFSLFNYVNELNNEIEKLEEQRAQIKAEAERVSAHDGVGGADSQSRRKVLKMLEDKLLVEEENTKRFRQKTEQATRILEDVMASVQTIFASIACDEGQIVNRHGTAGLTETSVLYYLAAIEAQTDKLIHQWRQLHAQDNGVVPAGPIRGPSMPPGSTAIHIDIPTTGEDLTQDVYSDDEETRPLGRDELLSKTQQKLSKTGTGGLVQRAGKKGKGGKRV